ncbi:MAG TPA: TatD family hydrolase [Flavobacterium sp.]|nr:TatD family hydrolase [Flavobacterium sp.]
MKYFNLHTHHFTNDAAVLELVNQYPMEFDDLVPFYSIGIHPWKIDENIVEAELLIVEDKLKNNKCLALGECGLDKRIETNLDLQTQVFEKQLLLAEKYKKPVVIHCVAAFQEVIAIKKKMKISVPMIIHGFSKNSQIANQLTENGFYVSFGKYLLRNPELEFVFKNIPNNQFFLETDTIEEGIDEVYKLAAKYKNIEVEELIRLIKSNVKTVFNQ